MFGVSGKFDFGYVGFYDFESLESFDVFFVCWREDADWCLTRSICNNHLLFYTH